jgi:uncharacterized lipoprotein
VSSTDDKTRLAALMVSAAALLAACSTREPARAPAPAPAPARPSPGAAAPVAPAPSSSARTWDQYRLAAARRITAANAGRTFDGAPPDVLLAIPVLEIELNADGSVRHVEVMRYPRQARDTVPLAIEAIKRAAPFGDVSRLPKPWKYTETFLFNDDRKFKLRSLDQ